MSASSRSPSSDDSSSTQEFAWGYWALIGIGGLFFLASILVVIGVPNLSGGLGSDDGTPSPTPEMNNGTSPTETTTASPTPTQTTTATPTKTATPTQTTTASPTPTQTTTSTQTPNQVVYRINVGGPRISTTGRGSDWSPDNADNPSPYLNAQQSNTVAQFTPDNITVENNVPPNVPNEMFKTYRFDQPSEGQMVWRFPVDSNRRYTVRLYFLEAYFTEGDSGRAYEEPYSEGGPRTFGVAIENRAVLQNYEPFKEHGHDVGAMKSFEVTVDDGVLEIRFLREVENPTVSGIEVIDTGPRRNASA